MAPQQTLLIADFYIYDLISESEKESDLPHSWNLKYDKKLRADHGKKGCLLLTYNCFIILVSTSFQNFPGKYTFSFDHIT